MEALQQSQVCDGIRVLPVEALVYMKLKSPRRKDAVDVIELVKAGADTVKIAAYLARYAPELSVNFNALVSEAEAE